MKFCLCSLLLSRTAIISILKERPNKADNRDKIFNTLMQNCEKSDDEGHFWEAMLAMGLTSDQIDRAVHYIIEKSIESTKKKLQGLQMFARLNNTRFSLN